LNYRLVVLAALLVVIGALIFVYPGILSNSSPSYDRTLLVRVAPANYSYFQAKLGPQQSLRATLSSSPEGVDFFLMNSGNFSAWTLRGNPPSDVYSQSKLDAGNYSFAVTGTGAPEDYYLVFISRSSDTPTNVLVHLVVNQVTPEATVVPLLFVAFGVALALIGATRRKKDTEVAAHEEESQEESQGGGFLGLFGGTGVGDSSALRKCRYCGAELGGDSAFCPSCGMSQR
jgi:hypothetical protein